MITILSSIAILAIAIFLFIKLPMFGALASGERLERIKKSPQFKNGSFANINNTPDLTEGVSIPTVLWDFLTRGSDEKTPKNPIPSKKTDLSTIGLEENVLIWFGHSSYFIQLDGVRILVDPVFSGAASPISFTTPAFAGTDIYTVDEFPAIDYLIISHDHWDHLDYKTVMELKPKVGKVICGLGVGAHFERWGFPLEQLVELDWHDDLQLADSMKLTALPERHFSGRGFSRNKSLWCSYAIQSANFSIFIGGDSGYDNHFAEIGTAFGEFDLAILENGQYNKNWKYIHMMPEETILAAKDLNAKALMPVHSGKFALSMHAWYEPLTEVSALNKETGLPLVTPMIGEKVVLGEKFPNYEKWWENVR
jgi:L-ascorbate metabolism protein UlaG (beta-lactamase superfamily)